MTDNKNTDNDLEQSRPVVYLNWFLRTFPRVISKQRYLAYASEVGESFRPIIPKYIVNASYAASIFYVGTDVWIHTHDMIQQNKPQKEIAIRTTDRLIWHSFASMILPALTVHSIVKYSGKGIDKYNMFSTKPKVRGWAPTLIALACIPFIIHPLDHVTDYAMDNTIRKLYNKL
ncbi:mitochondrial 18kda protein [Fadolivirus algeromassiliense]|jgi:fission process protein 1|uniref:Mitochondrial 18kda protein n=1 Tax=Fadolivirus FV1/VV64 TaxID=3070911 RepID=A0A7D3UQP8_9VIRU|nr:mitochondrial 18kda protein [Fadolivirus algeromassiliense]QKF94608.1 mitochondrial 18kda protein [Fadolivirus FV1/VV64]